MKGQIMIRGHLLSSLFLVALVGAAFSAAQQPAEQAPAQSPAQGAATPAAAQQTKITTTETVVVTAPGEFRDEQELQSTAMIE